MGAQKTVAEGKRQKNAGRTVKSQPRKKWEKPVLEDVSGKIMAQPYIRFT